MKFPWQKWDHILKLDPDKDLPSGLSYEDVCSIGTDAIEIGGTTGITSSKMEEVIQACSDFNVPLYQEPSSVGAVVHHEGLDGYLVPIVLNADSSAWVIGAHKEWAKLDPIIVWDLTWTEAYIVLNPDSAVARYTNADCDQSPEDVAAYAEVAEKFLNQPIVYIEYSGMLGDPKIVKSAHDALTESSLFYGGGISNYDSAYQMRSCCDTIVVGNTLYNDGLDAVIETVSGAKDAA